MARLQILEYPDPRLRTKAKPVEVFDGALAKLVADMFETMYLAPGVGLAATQVDVHKRLIVMDVSEGKDQPQVFCNPEILTEEGVGITEEGCLSVPGIFDEVKRAATVRARAQDVTGKTFEVDLEGLAAVCLQHEMDHLEGKLFVDYLSDLKRERIRKKLEKDRKERAVKARESTSARAY
jgi:peptide deformylase